MKKSGFACRILCMLLSLLFLTAIPAEATSVGDDMSVVQGCHSVDAQVPMLGDQPPIENAVSVFLYDYVNDVLLYSQNPDELHYPASLVKILTALLIIENGNLDDQVTVRQDVLDSLPSGSMSLDLKADEVLTLRDLLYAILVQASNEAAAVSADYISGSQEAFVGEMNAYAAKLGCTNTIFVNVHGLHDEGQFTTARDIARILSVAAKNETFMEVFSTVNYTIPATNLSGERSLSSNNYLMNDDIMTRYLDSRVTGGRAGTVDSGEKNLAVTAESNGMKVISIVLGSKSTLSESGRTVTFGSFEETTQLLDMGFKGGYHSVQLFYKGQVLEQFDVPNGESNLSIGVKDAVLALLPQSVKYEDLSYRFNEDAVVLQAPVEEGEIISTVQVWHNDLCLAQANLYALHDVNVRSIVATEEVTEEPKAGSTNILIVVAVIVGLLVVLLVGRRFLFRIIRSRKIRRQRKNRRRSH